MKEAIQKESFASVALLKKGLQLLNRKRNIG